MINGASRSKMGPRLGRVTAPARRGDATIAITSAGADKLQPGDWVDLWYEDVEGRFNTLM